MLASNKNIPKGSNCILFPVIKLLHMSQETSRIEVPREGVDLITYLPLTARRHAPSLAQGLKPEVRQTATACALDS